MCITKPATLMAESWEARVGQNSHLRMIHAGSRDLDIYAILLVTGGSWLLLGVPGLLAMYQQEAFHSSCNDSP